VSSTDPTAAIIPPIRQLIRCGATLEKSNAGETKFATMLMPIVAIMKVRAPSTTAVVESRRATVCTGSSISSPNTGFVAAAVMTTSSAKTRTFTGSPRKFPRRTAANERP
jgi:hypothetical protein